MGYSESPRKYVGARHGTCEHIGKMVVAAAVVGCYVVKFDSSMLSEGRHVYVVREFGIEAHRRSCCACNTIKETQ
jgi:hypothetical protein